MSAIMSPYHQGLEAGHVAHGPATAVQVASVSDLISPPTLAAVTTGASPDLADKLLEQHKL